MITPDDPIIRRMLQAGNNRWLFRTTLLAIAVLGAANLVVAWRAM